MIQSARSGTRNQLVIRLKPRMPIVVTGFSCRIEIIAVLCSLSSPENCHRETVTTSDFAEVSIQSCLMGAPQLAKWMKQHPAEVLAAWRCVIWRTGWQRHLGWKSSFPGEFAANPIGAREARCGPQRPDQGVEPRSYHISAPKTENGQRICQFDKVKQARMPWRSGSRHRRRCLKCWRGGSISAKVRSPRSAC